MSDRATESVLLVKPCVDELVGRIWELLENYSPEVLRPNELVIVKQRALNYTALRYATCVHSELNKLADSSVEKSDQAQRLFDKIKHGDESHQEWLAKELELFFKSEVRR